MHTPGPWHTNASKSKTHPHGITATALDFEHTLTVNEEDARLIAAAPDLLDALQAVAGDSIAMRGFHEQFRATIHAAIAKATKEI